MRTIVTTITRYNFSTEERALLSVVTTAIRGTAKNENTHTHTHLAFFQISDLVLDDQHGLFHRIVVFLLIDDHHAGCVGRHFSLARRRRRPDRPGVRRSRTATHGHAAQTRFVFRISCRHHDNDGAASRSACRDGETC